MLKELVKKIKPNLHKILMISGVLILVVYMLITKALNINTNNTWAAYLGFFLSGAPFCSGLWIYSNNIKQRQSNLSKVIKVILIWFIVSITVAFIIFMVQKVELLTGKLWIGVIIGIVLVHIIFIVGWIIYNKRVNRKEKTKYDSH